MENPFDKKNGSIVFNSDKPLFLGASNLKLSFWQLVEYHSLQSYAHDNQPEVERLLSQLYPSLFFPGIPGGQIATSEENNQFLQQCSVADIITLHPDAINKVTAQDIPHIRHKIRQFFTDKANNFKVIKTPNNKFVVVPNRLEYEGGELSQYGQTYAEAQPFKLPSDKPNPNPKIVAVKSDKDVKITLHNDGTFEVVRINSEILMKLSAAEFANTFGVFMAETDLANFPLIRDEIDEGALNDLSYWLSAINNPSDKKFIIDYQQNPQNETSIQEVGRLLRVVQSFMPEEMALDPNNFLSKFGFDRMDKMIQDIKDGIISNDIGLIYWYLKQSAILILDQKPELNEQMKMYFGSSITELIQSIDSKILAQTPQIIVTPIQDISSNARNPNLNEPKDGGKAVIKINPESNQLQIEFPPNKKDLLHKIVSYMPSSGSFSKHDNTLYLDLNRDSRIRLMSCNKEDQIEWKDNILPNLTKFLNECGVMKVGKLGLNNDKVLDQADMEGISKFLSGKNERLPHESYLKLTGIYYRNVNAENFLDKSTTASSMSNYAPSAIYSKPASLPLTTMESQQQELTSSPSHFADKDQERKQIKEEAETFIRNLETLMTVDNFGNIDEIHDGAVRQMKNFTGCGLLLRNEESFRAASILMQNAFEKIAVADISEPARKTWQILANSLGIEEYVKLPARRGY